jgi:hypothetical protein
VIDPGPNTGSFTGTMTTDEVRVEPPWSGALVNPSDQKPSQPPRD